MLLARASGQDPAFPPAFLQLPPLPADLQSPSLHTFRVFICEKGPRPCLVSLPSIGDNGPHKEGEGAAPLSGLNASENPDPTWAMPSIPLCLST